MVDPAKGDFNITQKKSTVIVAICIVALTLPWIYPTTQAQADTTFKPTDQFAIPADNSTINFATAGTYAQAALENGVWTFGNLSLQNSPLLENLEFSAQDSNVTITLYRTFNTTTIGASLRYIVVGEGVQTINLGVNRQVGYWSISVNGVFVGENDGWVLSPDGSVTITGATSNVTITYYSSFGPLGSNGNATNQPFYQQHSVLIITAIAITVAVVLTLAISRKNKRGEMGQSDNLINKHTKQDNT